VDALPTELSGLVVQKVSRGFNPRAET
jgi:hypothetical protein